MLAPLHPDGIKFVAIGAVVTVIWPRGAVDGEAPPRQEFRL